MPVHAATWWSLAAVVKIGLLCIRCEEGEHNDLATLFLSSSHHTIINLFSMGHNPGEAYVVHFTQGSLVLFVVIYLILMSVGAGVAIPGGLFMPSIMVSACCT
jgi:chloride channel 7